MINAEQSGLWYLFTCLQHLNYVHNYEYWVIVLKSLSRLLIRWSLNFDLSHSRHVAILQLATHILHLRILSHLGSHLNLYILIFGGCVGHIDLERVWSILIFHLILLRRRIIIIVFNMLNMLYLTLLHLVCLSMMILIVLISNLTLIQWFILSYIFGDFLTMPICHSPKKQASGIAQQKVKDADCSWKIQSIFYGSL